MVLRYGGYCSVQWLWPCLACNSGSSEQRVLKKPVRSKSSSCDLRKKFESNVIHEHVHGVIHMRSCRGIS